MRDAMKPRSMYWRSFAEHRCMPANAGRAAVIRCFIFAHVKRLRLPLLNYSAVGVNSRGKGNLVRRRPFRGIDVDGFPGLYTTTKQRLPFKMATKSA